MADAFGESTWQGKLQTILRVFGGGELVLALRNILETWVLLEQLGDRIGYHGMYEILDYQSTLDIPDVTGDEATIARREVIRFLQESRKNAGFDISDRIQVRWSSEDGGVTAAIEEHRTMIAEEVLATSFEPGEGEGFAAASHELRMRASLRQR